MASRKKGKSSGGSAGNRNRERPAGPSTRLIYVHGIGWQEPLEQLRHLWDLALFGRALGEDDGVQSHMARWSDLLHADPAPMTARSLSLGDELERPGRQIDLDAVLREVGIDGETDEAAMELAEGLLAHLGMRAPGRDVGKRVLPLPGFLRRPLARVFLKAFVGDTAAYFFDADMRRRIRERLEVLLPTDEHEEIVLVTHSMGTVIAFEVLHARAKDGRPVNVRQFVTLGSPLGITEIQDFLDAPLAIPPGVREWLNFADPLDPVALDKGLGNDFEPTAGVTIDDRLIVNERTTRGNPHSSLGYLADPKVRKEVSQTLRIDTMRRFLVARDVACELGEYTRRQSVLLEVLLPEHKALGGLASPAHTRAMPLPERVARMARKIEKIVAADGGAAAVEAARIDPLRHFVAAHLLPHELLQITERYADLLVYSVWKSARKSKLMRHAAASMQADAARNSYGSRGEGVRWAVLDTGVQGDHPHFATHGTIEAVWDCTKRGKPRRLAAKDQQDKDGHGTHVCGILAGEQAAPGDGGAANVGLAPRARLHVYKVLDDKGHGEDAWIIKALDHIAEHNAGNGSPAIHGLNLSLGGPFDSTVYGCGHSPICQELRRLWRDGVLVVVASGNEGKVAVETTDGETELNSPMSIGDPANLEECIAVGSVHNKKPHLYGVSAFSSRGPTADGRCKPDVVAPGERIWSCSSHWKGRGGPYREESGTSMAAPAVSGLLAAYLSARNEFMGRPDEVKALLMRTCNDLGRDRYHQGRGLPNLMKMLLES